MELSDAKHYTSSSIKHLLRVFSESLPIKRAFLSVSNVCCRIWFLCSRCRSISFCLSSNRAPVTTCEANDKLCLKLLISGLSLTNQWVPLSKSAEINTDPSFADVDCFPSGTGLLALRIETLSQPTCL